MVLHHVAQRAGLIVIGDAVFQPHRLGHGDLHVIDMGRVPQRLVEHVGEAQRHQVLHRLLAQIVVDAEDLVFAEIVADKVVERAGRIEVAANRLFHNDARIGRDQPVLAQLVRNIAEQGRRDGQIEGADAVAFADRLLQSVESGAARRIGRNVGQAGEKGLQLLVVDIAGLDVVGDRLASEGLEFGVRQFRARRPDDPRRLAELMVALAIIERGQQLALGEVPGAAEDNEVERVDGDDLARHGMSLRVWPKRRPSIF